MCRGIEKLKCGNFKGDQGKIMWNFHQSWIQAMEFPKGVTHF